METEKIKLTNTAEVQLWKIPRSKWAEIKRLFLANDYMSIITIWNNSGVSAERICPGCPWAVKIVHPHIQILVKKYEAEDEGKERALDEATDDEEVIKSEITPTQLVYVEEVIIESKKTKKGGKDKSGQGGQDTSGEKGEGLNDLGAENIIQE